jgi:predicted membrane protein (TIGR00267 family)
MMDFELKLECPQRSKSWISASVMGLSYFIGGLIPMIPYFVYTEINHAFVTSIGITVIILLIFGYIKAMVTGCTSRESTISAVQTLLVGALAAATSYWIVRAVNEKLGG